MTLRHSTHGDFDAVLLDVQEGQLDLIELMELRDALVRVARPGMMWVDDANGARWVLDEDIEDWGIEP